MATTRCWGTFATRSGRPSASATAGYGPATSPASPTTGQSLSRAARTTWSSSVRSTFSQSRSRDVLREHAALADACVFGVPDRDLGEALAAWVIPRPRATVDSDELRAFCRQQLAAFKVPGAFKVVDEFPLTASGKVQRFQLRAAMAAEKASR